MHKRNDHTPVAISGYYGHGNFGDDHFIHKTIQICSELGVSPILSTPPLEGVSRASFTTPKWLTKVYASHTIAGATVRLASALITHARCRSHILSGGSILVDVRGSRKAQLVLERAIGPRRWIAAGISLGPFATQASEDRVSTFCMRAQGIAVRDDESLAIARRWQHRNAVHLGDLAAFGEIPHPEPITRVAVVCCREVADPVMHAVASTAAAMAKREGYALSVVSINSNPLTGDDEQARRVSDGLRAQGFEHDLTLYRDHNYHHILGILRSSAVASGRLHGGLVALFAGQPACIVEYHPKVGAILADLNYPMSRRIAPGAPETFTTYDLSPLSFSELETVRGYCRRSAGILAFVGDLITPPHPTSDELEH